MNYIVIDLEMCPVGYKARRAFPMSNEIIQIGAVKLDEEFNETDHFSSFVAPEFGKLDDFVKQLTGITEKALRKAPKLKDALADLLKFIGEEEYRIYAWSESDHYQMSSELSKKQLDRNADEALTHFLDKANWVDYQKCFGSRLGTNRCISLEDAVASAALTFEGHAHDGLADAHNTANLIAKLERDPAFVLAEVSRKPRYEATTAPLSFDLGGLFAGIVLEERLETRPA